MEEIKGFKRERNALKLLFGEPVEVVTFYDQSLEYRAEMYITNNIKIKALMQLDNNKIVSFMTYATMQGEMK